MALRNILYEGDPTLRKHCRKVDEVNSRMKMIIDDMVETMQEAGGIGLAAPQVGIIRRIFVAQPDKDGEVYVFVNPEIVSMEGTQESEEGCLSVPGFTGLVERPEKVTVRGLDRNGKKHEETFDDIAAIVMCHEFDHLEGILYTDKASEIHEVINEPEDEEGDEAEEKEKEKKI